MSQHGKSGMPLSEIFRSIDTPEGKKRVFDYLKTEPYPHFEQTDTPGVYVRIDADGTRTTGRFVSKVFEPIVAQRKAA